ncbi:hypothetical protein A1O7_07111 [Cladophialophora yegresii CBS 114405]|uniref:Amidase domain-containing protein n=1 Tax=Cladophialophora yegresii CBS 114405 TaxID=1182544 RepID=W9VM45_9EURO|nr:uncharacterized protein A1O7_07111 [Cladophialophora yegresii CBS 114405]EXJ56767.1 hypothetical protein A1O7_07111 [Cladophialophora yegresii CBS 114405]
MGPSVRDVEIAWDVMRAFDERDVFARRQLPTWPAWRNPVRFAVPPADELQGQLSPAYAALFGKVVDALSATTWCTCIEAPNTFDYAPFAAANQMLYDSPIVAQRLLAFQSYIASHPGLEDLHPAIRTTFQQAQGQRFSAVRAYDDIFRLAGLRRQADIQFQNRVDVLVVPSTVDHFTVAQLEEELWCGTRPWVGSRILSTCLIWWP